MEQTHQQAIVQQMESLTWYHTIDLGQGMVTPGLYDHRPYLGAYGIPKDLTGRTALDIGAASGFFTFEMEKRGAQVTSTELPEWGMHDFGPQFRTGGTSEQEEQYLHDPYSFASQVLDSKAKRKLINIYDISPETMGSFDLVFCGSVLLHLTDPIKALRRIQSVTREAAIIATAIHPLQTAETLALFVGSPDGLAWWYPNQATLEQMVKSAGFKGWEWFSDFRLDYTDEQPGPYHGVMRAWNTPTRPDILEVTDQPPSGLIKSVREPLEVHQLKEEVNQLKDLVAGYENRVARYESMRSVRFELGFHSYLDKLKTLFKPGK